MEVTLDEIKLRFWLTGNLQWKMHAAQLAIDRAYEKSTGKLFVADCSRQLGKSTWAVNKCVSKALQKPGARIRYATAYLTDLEQFILPAFDFVLGGIPDGLKPKFNAVKMEFRFPPPFHSKIRLVGLDRKPNGLRGNRLDLVVLDEAGYMSRLDYQYSYVLIPSTTHVPDAKIIMASTQPESPDHEFVGFCDRAEIAGAYVKLDVHQNPLLTTQQIDEIAKECGGYLSTAFRREYLCERVVEEGRAIVPEFNTKFHVKPTEEGKYHQWWHRLEALDSGVRDQTACLFAYYDFGRAVLVIEDEFAITGSQVTTRRINEHVRAKESALKYEKVYRRTADNDNLILIQDLGTEFGLYFNPTSKDSLAAMVNKVRLWFQKNRIEIHPRCVRLISALKSGIWDKNRVEFSRSKVHGHFDLIAALVYLVRNCPEAENPIPDWFGWDGSNQFFQHGKKGISKNAEALKQAFNIQK